MPATATPIRQTQISADEWKTRVELAACYRLFVRYGWTDLIFTHLSARVPNESELYLINPYGLLFDEVTASSLLKVDFDGNVVSGDYPYNDAGHAIHTAILKARPDVNVVLHSHTRAGMAVSAMECGLLPLTQQANEMMDNTVLHPYDLATSNEEECEHLGRSIADKHAMIMLNHGLLTCGRTVAEAFYYMYTLESACKVQVDALASGQKLVTPKEAAIRRLAAYGKAPENEPIAAGARAWPALIRMLDKIDPSYKT
jgi:ribulose-5-phosphate 4-epimerase/fuculose-1-phosphate aldolase